MLQLFRRHRLWLLLSAIAGLALRLFFIHKFAQANGDALIYGDIALNWMRHGIYGLNELGAIRPTLIRLPGYTMFLVACFRLFGAEHYHAVMYVQTAFDLGTAWILAATALRMGARERGALAVFTLYCLFPYTAVFAACALTETLTLFFLALAIYLFMGALQQPRASSWAECGGACAVTVILRPDGGLVLFAFGAYLLWRWARRKQIRSSIESFGSSVVRPTVILGVVALLPLLPWAIRNYRTFHIIQPLVPANATDPGEAYDAGFVRWTKTWILDFVSVYEIGWNVPGDTIDGALLPTRAFDSAAQRQRTLELIAAYNQNPSLPADLDAQFAALAATRIHSHPLRYYAALPLGRVADMWLRPRTEQFPIEARWWEYDAHEGESIFAVAYAALGIITLVFAALGLWRGRLQFAGVLVSYIVLRSAFLLTVGTAEPRYTIECWPMMLLFAGVGITSIRDTRSSHSGPSADVSMS